MTLPLLIFMALVVLAMIVVFVGNLDDVDGAFAAVLCVVLASVVCFGIFMLGKWHARAKPIQWNAVVQEPAP